MSSRPRESFSIFVEFSNAEATIASETSRSDIRFLACSGSLKRMVSATLKLPVGQAYYT